ncbi:hypothetical protein VTN77DRAFT_5309 [Rasamsonia byssochlamydoides]|uniref:uncharacterized protein n=1 Tax=Rasamsonia byssochlamydoides TaxID=89139 RepID=UPI003743A164
MASHPKYNEKTTATEVADAFAGQITGKIVLITGINPKGLGAATAHAIAAHSPQLLILASRTPSKIKEVDNALQSSFPGLKTKPVQVDLASLASVRRAADEINRSVERIDIIINNAGIMALPEKQLSPDGVEMQLAANHLGHFLLTSLLVDKLKAAADDADKKTTRVINVASGGHCFSSIRFQDYNFEGKPVSPDEGGYPSYLAAWKMGPEPFQEYNKWVAYGQSKTANILFSLALTRKLHGHGILSFAVYPGEIITDLVRFVNARDFDDADPALFTWKSADQGSATTVVAGFDPALKENTGLYLKDCQIFPPAPYAADLERAERLWELSERLVGQEFEI